MSKKTNAEKQRTKMKPKHQRIARRGKRPNPARAFTPEQLSGVGLLGDPIIMRHMLGFVARMIELQLPDSRFEYKTGEPFVAPADIGAEFEGIDADFPDEPAETQCTCGHTFNVHMASSGKMGRCGAMVPWQDQRKACPCQGFEGLASTVNSESPNLKEGEKAEE